MGISPWQSYLLPVKVAAHAYPLLRWAKGVPAFHTHSCRFCVKAALPSPDDQNGLLLPACWLLFSRAGLWTQGIQSALAGSPAYTVHWDTCSVPWRVHPFWAPEPPALQSSGLPVQAAQWIIRSNIKLFLIPELGVHRVLPTEDVTPIKASALVQIPMSSTTVATSPLPALSWYLWLYGLGERVLMWPAGGGEEKACAFF